MSQPDLIIRTKDLTRNGALTTESVQKIKKILENGGAVLLPSDTCYSLAVLPLNESMRKRVNTILDREDIPISFAFPNYEVIKKYMEIKPGLATLFKKFTPGCITIICKAKDRSFADISRSQDGTVGVRLTDCEIERTVAGCTPHPITTVPPLKNNKGIQDFDLAIEIVQKGMEKLEKPIKWAAIESEKFYSERSTVVTVTGDERLLCIREGVVPFYSIEAAFAEHQEDGTE